MSETRIVLSAIDPRRIEAYKKIFKWYGVKCEEIEGATRWNKNWDPTTYFIATCETGIAKMIMHDVHQLDRPQMLRRSFHGSLYLRNLLAPYTVNDALEIHKLD